MIWNLPPDFLSFQSDIFHKQIYPEYRKKYQVIDPESMEVFCFHHGLRNRLRKWSIINVGAYNGDSALVLSEYGKDVYSIEMSEQNFQKMKEVLAANPNYSANVHVVHAGVWTRGMERLAWNSLPSTTSCGTVG
jgi:predicted O-methyltransferase YrrM